MVVEDDGIQVRLLSTLQRQGQSAEWRCEKQIPNGKLSRNTRKLRRPTEPSEEEGRGKSYVARSSEEARH